MQYMIVAIFLNIILHQIEQFNGIELTAVKKV